MIRHLGNLTGWVSNPSSPLLGNYVPVYGDASCTVNSPPGTRQAGALTGWVSNPASPLLGNYVPVYLGGKAPAAPGFRHRGRLTGWVSNPSSPLLSNYIPVYGGEVCSVLGTNCSHCPGGLPDTLYITPSGFSNCPPLFTDLTTFDGVSCRVHWSTTDRFWRTSQPICIEGFPTGFPAGATVKPVVGGTAHGALNGRVQCLGGGVLVVYLELITHLDSSPANPYITEFVWQGTPALSGNMRTDQPGNLTADDCVTPHFAWKDQALFFVDALGVDPCHPSGDGCTPGGAVDVTA